LKWAWVAFVDLAAGCEAPANQGDVAFLHGGEEHVIGWLLAHRSVKIRPEKCCLVGKTLDQRTSRG
jgi:hypothetical protein